jgi:hypothetical protein
MVTIYLKIKIAEKSNFSPTIGYCIFIEKFIRAYNNIFFNNHI